jgi:hypothetical protein
VPGKPGVQERRPAEDHRVRGLDLRCADGGVVAGAKRRSGLAEKPFDRPDELVPGERAVPVAEVDDEDQCATSPARSIRRTPL